MIRTTRRLLLAAFAAPAIVPARAGAQAFAARPLTWVVPFPPGNIADATSRVLARHLGQVLGQRVAVDNRPGAGGTIGTETVVRAAADGNTLLFGSQGPLAVAPRMGINIRYDPLRDLAPVHGIGASPLIIVVGRRQAWSTLGEFVASARAHPEKLVYASPGVGTSPHLAAEMLQMRASLFLHHLPYVNPAQALNDIVGGRVDVTWDYPLSALPYIGQGHLRALAVTDHTRPRAVLDVPTLAECGYPGAELSSWAGVFAPARTPGAVIAQLADALGQTLLEPTVQAFFDDAAMVPWLTMGPERLGEFVAEEQFRIAALLARVGARPG